MTTKQKWDLGPAVTLLDLTQRDVGWVFDVRVRELGLENSCRCVLGQLEGSYTQGREAVGIGITDGYLLGLDIEENDSREYRRLTKAWRRKLNRLREDPERIRAWAAR